MFYCNKNGLKMSRAKLAVTYLVASCAFSRTHTRSCLSAFGKGHSLVRKQKFAFGFCVGLRHMFPSRSRASSDR